MMKRKRVTVQDVAVCCGLSKSTVAYVLREPITCKASAATKKKVAMAVRKLDYRTNPAARALSTRRYRAIGVLMPPVGGYYHELMVRLDKALHEHNHYGVFSFWELGASDKDAGNSYQHSFLKLCDHGIDGVITTGYLGYDEFLTKLNMPVVIYGNDRPFVDCVYPDKVVYMKETVEYLLRHGHRKIGFLGLKHEIRVEVLRQELARNGLPVNEDWFVNCLATPEQGMTAMRKLLASRNRPDAVILHSDYMMPGVLTVAKEMAMRIPEDISIISYDNLPESLYFAPPLTTFDQCLSMAAKMLVETMLKRIDAPILPQLKMSFKMPLIERRSVRMAEQVLKAGRGNQ